MNDEVKNTGELEYHVVEATANTLPPMEVSNTSPDIPLVKSDEKFEYVLADHVKGNTYYDATQSPSGNQPSATSTLEKAKLRLAQLKALKRLVQRETRKNILKTNLKKRVVKRRKKDKAAKLARKRNR